METREPGAAKSSRNPFRCFDRGFLVESLIAGAIVIAAALFERPHPRGSWERWTAALVQSLAFGWIVVRSMLALRRLDELQRQIHLVAIAIAFTVTGVLAVAIGFFEMAGLPRPPWGVGLWMVMSGVWFVAVVVLNRRYR